LTYHPLARCGKRNAGGAVIHMRTPPRRAVTATAGKPAGASTLSKDSELAGAIKALVVAGERDAARERFADLVANEVNPNRTDLVRRTLAAVIARGRPGRVTVRTGDGREVGAAEPDAYDRVLVDAPCTGLGALRRRPEARWRRQPSDVPGLATLQRDLLTSALDATRPGGVVAYATCSPHLGETRFVVSDVVDGIDEEFDGAIATYASQPELEPLIDRYLADPAERQRLAGHGRAIVLAQHTFDHRVRALCSVADALARSRPQTIDEVKAPPPVQVASAVEESPSIEVGSPVASELAAS